MFERSPAPPYLTGADLVALKEVGPNHFVGTFYAGGAEVTFHVGVGGSTYADPVEQTDEDISVSASLVSGWRSDGVQLVLKRSGYPSRTYTLMLSGNG